MRVQVCDTARRVGTSVDVVVVMGRPTVPYLRGPRRPPGAEGPTHSVGGEGEVHPCTVTGQKGVGRETPDRKDG